MQGAARNSARGRDCSKPMTESTPEKKSELLRALIRALKFTAILLMFLEFVLHCLHPITLFVASTVFLAVVFGLVVLSVFRVNQ